MLSPIECAVFRVCLFGEKKGRKRGEKRKVERKGKGKLGGKSGGPRSFLLGLTKKFLPNSGKKSEKKLG